MVEDGVVDATFHDEPIAQVLPSSPFFALSPPTYTKYELAYPCGNDANTGRCRPYHSILSLEKNNWTQACPGLGQAWVQFVFSSERMELYGRQNPVFASFPQGYASSYFV